LKKIIIIFVLLFYNLFAIDKNSTLKIYNKVLTSIFKQQVPIIYITNREYRDILRYSNKIKISDNPNKAILAIVTTKDEIDKIKHINPNIIIFATKEKLLFDNQSVIGAFYWKKGRSQLIFIKDRLDRYHIQLPDEYNQFIIEL